MVPSWALLKRGGLFKTWISWEDYRLFGTDLGKTLVSVSSSFSHSLPGHIMNKFPWPHMKTTVRFYRVNAPTHYFQNRKSQSAFVFVSRTRTHRGSPDSSSLSLLDSNEAHFSPCQSLPWHLYIESSNGQSQNFAYKEYTPTDTNSCPFRICLEVNTRMNIHQTGNNIRCCQQMIG